MPKLDIQKNVTKSKPVSKLSDTQKADAKRKLESLIKEETRTVRGIFQNFECPGGSAPVTVSKYPGIEPFSQILEDGKEYEVPLYVARFLNGVDISAEAINGKLGTCSYPVHSFIMDQDGNPTISHEKRKKRFGFQSLEFAGGL